MAEFIEWLEISMWITIIVINYVIMGVIMQRRRTVENPLTQKYFLGMIAFFFIHGISRIFYLYYDFFNPDPGNELTLQIGQLLGISSVVALIYYIEITIFKKTKRIFSFYGIISVILATISILLQTPDLTNILLQITIPVLGVIIPVMYFIIAKNTTGRLRNISLVILLGIFLFEVGQMAHTSTARELVGEFVVWASPLFMLMGLIIIGIGFYKSNE